MPRLYENSRVVSYNVQSAVDTKHHLIVPHDVTNVPDRGQLASMTKPAQEALQKKGIFNHSLFKYHSNKNCSL
ncbi:hypothetical protein [Pseudoalteromonas piscicida]|uniref:hypothetical protein n=1 Tax=Pseudoalteromonas piscicida TaxID=43662 RepID=UPI0027E584D3|nr:hypothetical protein [Pseudoalteromonas piscicida]WMO15852.1 hypothetical protein NI376_06760 [Pseudoalteromonas piscicida]